MKTITTLAFLGLITETFCTNSPGSFSIPLKKRDDNSQVYGLNNVNRTVEARIANLQARVARAGLKFAHHFNTHSTTNIKQPKLKRSKGSVQMGDGTGDFYYYASVVIGNPSVSFDLILDTGSSDLVVLAAPCYYGCDNSTQLYQPQNSATSKVSTIPFAIEYGIGEATGVLINDEVKLGGFSVNQTFGALHNSSSIYHAQGSVTGLLGLAWGNIAASHAVPFLQHLFLSKQLDQPLFTLALAREGLVATSTGGIMNIGSINQDFYQGNITWNAAPIQEYWQTSLAGVSLGGVSLGISSPVVVIDSGSSLLYFSKSAVLLFYSKIPGATEIGGGLFSYTCGQAINLSFKFNGVDFTVSDVDFNAGLASADSTTICIGAVAYFPGSDLWILGDVFLKNVYSIFRFSPPSIGFAMLANPEQLLNGYIPTSNATSIANGGNSTLVTVPAQVAGKMEIKQPQAVPMMVGAPNINASATPAPVIAPAPVQSLTTITTKYTTTFTTKNKLQTATKTTTYVTTIPTPPPLTGADAYAQSLLCGFTSSVTKGGDGSSPAEVEEEYKSAVLYYKKIANFSPRTLAAYTALFKCT